MSKNKKKHPTYKKIYIILLIMATLFMGVGYAAINSVTLDISGNISANTQDGVFITDASFITDTSGNSKIIQYYQTIITSDVVLPTDTSSVELKLTIYNSTDSTYTFNGVDYLVGEDTYSNQNITFELDGLEVDQELDAGDSVIFTVTFKYVDSNNIDLTNLLSVLNFEFEEYIRTVITYDYNYLPDNQFENMYNTSTFSSCCGSATETSNYFYVAQRKPTTEGLMYETTMYPKNNFTDEWVRGYYFINKTATPLVDGQTYTLMFETKGSGHFKTAMIGVEQDITRIYEIPTAWTRHTLTFQAYTKDASLAAFIVYDWGVDSVYPTIKLRNVQLQSGGEELYTKSDILRANRVIGDNLKTLTRTDCTFLGWFTDPIEGTQITSDTLVPKEATTYYAHWSYNVQT